MLMTFFGRAILATVVVGLAAAMPSPAVVGPYQQAPMLDERVAAGELPPVEERLPDEPMVVQPVHQIGVYGGTWRRLAAQSNDIGFNSRLGYETLMRWDRDGRTVIPNIAHRVEVLDDAKTYIFHLRPGMRWSDGAPFTSADFQYHYDYVLKNQTLTVSVPDYLKVDGELFEMETPDELTVIIRFQDSYGMFPELLSFRGRQGSVFSPSHYLKQFHAEFTDEAELDRVARREGYTGWNAYYHDRANLERNPECPTLAAWQVTVPFPAARSFATRNPYYWKVDPAGNQLPYIDHISYITVLDRTVLNLKAISGDVDFQARHIDTANFTLFMQSRKREGYRVNVGYSDSITNVYLNQSSQDPVLGPLLRNRDFRIALSLAINREEMVDIIYTGLAQIDAGVVIPDDPFYSSDLADADYIDYDPERANRILDDLGLERGVGGIRELPNGESFRQILHIYPSETGSNADFWQLVADYWREIGLHFIVKIESAPLSVLQVRSGSTNFWCYTNTSMHWAVDGIWKVPLSAASYFAPLYGQYYVTNGKHGVKPPPEHQQLVDWYKELVATPSLAERQKYADNILRQWWEQCYIISLARPGLLTIISDRFHNVPEKILHNYRLMTPGYIGIEQFYIDESQPPMGEHDWRQPAGDPPPYLYQPAP